MMMEREPDEYELALRARDGDREALAELVERTRLRLFTLAYAELRNYDDAQDAVASALLQICRHVGELREPERVRAWMQSIVRNEVRRLRRDPDAAAASLEEGAEGQTEDAGLSLLRLDIDRALRRLPGNEAETLRLFYLDELSIDDIAGRTGRPEGTIKSWLHRGRRHLAAEMKEFAPMPRPRKTDDRPAEPPRKAALIHTDLDAAVVQQVTQALRAQGYRTRILTPGDLSRLETLKTYQYIIMDEMIGGRPALELLINIRADPATRDIPVCVLWPAGADLSGFAISAYFCAGAERLVRTDDPAALAHLAYPAIRGTRFLRGFTERLTQRVRRICALAQEKARERRESSVGPEHLFLALIQESDCKGARILAGHLVVSLDQLRSEIERRMTREPGPAGQEMPMRLPDRGGRVLDFATVEALRLGNNYIGSEHLLLGLIAGEQEPIAQSLTELGADLAELRRAVEASCRPGDTPPTT